MKRSYKVKVSWITPTGTTKRLTIAEFYDGYDAMRFEKQRMEHNKATGRDKAPLYEYVYMVSPKIQPGEVK